MHEYQSKSVEFKCGASVHSKALVSKHFRFAMENIVYFVKIKCFKVKQSMFHLHAIEIFTSNYFIVNFAPFFPNTNIIAALCSTNAHICACIRLHLHIGKYSIHKYIIAHMLSIVVKQPLYFCIFIFIQLYFEVVITLIAWHFVKCPSFRFNVCSSTFKIADN